MSHHVAIIAYDGLCTFEFGCAVELFALERPMFLQLRPLPQG